MKRLIPLSSRQRNKILLLFSLFSISLAIGSLVLILTVESPGDGPARATIAYQWARQPYLSTWGVWPPGFMYLSGMFSLILNNPLISTRLLNLIIGSLTVPLFYLLIERVYKRDIALASTALFMILPLRIGLSASSLTEISFFGEIIAAMLCSISAVKCKNNQWPSLLLSSGFLSLAEMTRYETWVILPIFPLYYFSQTKKFWSSLTFLILLLIFPMLWSLGNYFQTGDPFWGFSVPIADTRGTVDLGDAIEIIARKFIPNLGWLLSVLMLAGVIWRIVYLAKVKRINSSELLYLAIFGFYWIVMVKFAMTRGPNFWDRFLLFGFAFGLPFVALPFKSLFKKSRKNLIAFILIALTSLTVSRIFNKSDIYVVRDRPTDVQQILNWLKTSPYNNDPILLTKIDWRSTYFSLYFPEKSSQFFIVDLLSEPEIEKILKQKPSLLITHRHDYRQRKKIEALLGRKIEKERLVYQLGSIRVYDIKSLVSTQNQKPNNN